MGIIVIRDSEAAKPSDDIGKNVGIVIGCLVALAVLLPLISRAFRCFGRAPAEEASASASQTTSHRRHLNAAEIMRLCALRDSARSQEEKLVQKTLLTSSEVELAAPKVSYAILFARNARKASIAKPPKALIREQTTARTSGGEATGASVCAEKHGLVTVLAVEEDESGPVCSICLEGYEDDDVVRETVCHHVFHSCCLEQWLMKRRSHCPLCQGDLKLKREEC